MTFVKGTASGATGVVTSSVNGDGCSPLVSVDAQSTVIDCDADPATCALLCARSSPPAWCAY
jgi:hypothetical protein